MYNLFAGAAAAVSTALTSPAATLLRTEYERQQQALPLFQRDKWIAEPGLFALAILLSIYLVWKLRRDLRKSKEENAKYQEMMAEAKRLQDAEDEAERLAGDEALLEATEAAEELPDAPENPADTPLEEEI